MKKAQATISIVLIILILVIIGLVMLIANPFKPNIGGNNIKEILPEEKNIYFQLESFNPVWAVYSGYKCHMGKLTIQANTYHATNHIYGLLGTGHLDCYFKVGDYSSKGNIPTFSDDYNLNIGDFDTSKGYSIMLCCNAYNQQGEKISEEVCRTEYLEPLCEN